MSDVIWKNFLQEELWDIVDEIVTIDMAIARIQKEHLDGLEQKKKLLKAKVERNMWDEHTKVIEWKIGKAVWVTQNRKSLDTEVLFYKYSIPQAEVDSCTTINPVSFIKISKK